MPALEAGCALETLAAAGYAAALAARGAWVGRAARWSARAGWLLLTAALLMQWRARGLAQPPWLEAPGVWLLAAWALPGALWLSESAWDAPGAGLPATALAAAWGAAALRAPGGAPAPLRDYWVLVHAPSGAVAFALCLVGAWLSAARLAAAGVPGERFQGVLAAAALLTLCASGAEGSHATLSRAGAVQAAAIACLALYLCLSVTVFWLEFQDRRVHASRLHWQAQAAPPSPAPRAGIRRAARAWFWVATAALAVSLCAFRPWREPGLFSWLAVLVALCVWAAALPGREPADPEDLGRAAYRAALHAFPWLTLHWVSGAALAYELSGDSWSGQPRQSWVFAAWLGLALALHLRPERLSAAVWACAQAVLVLLAAAAPAWGGG